MVSSTQLFQSWDCLRPSLRSSYLASMTRENVLQSTQVQTWTCTDLHTWNWETAYEFSWFWTRAQFEESRYPLFHTWCLWPRDRFLIMISHLHLCIHAEETATKSLFLIVVINLIVFSRTKYKLKILFMIFFFFFNVQYFFSYAQV